MARTSLAHDNLASGRLVRVLPQMAPSAYRYFFVCRPEAARQRKIVCFRQWLIGEMRGIADQHRAPISADPTLTGAPTSVP